jgi:hypothetical protein
LQDLQAVYRLTHACYVNNKYCAPHPSGLVIHYPIFDHISETTTLIAMLHGKIAGAISLTEDSPVGLSIDAEFKQDCDRIRHEGKRVGAVWRLVVEESSHNSRTVVVHLMNAMIDLLLQKKISTALMAVNPKHKSVYERMLNASAIGYAEGTAGLQSAPAVLLSFDPADLPEGSALSRKRQINPIHNLILNSGYLAS